MWFCFLLSQFLFIFCYFILVFFFFSKRYHLTHFDWLMVHDTGALMVRKQVKSGRITPSKGAKCTCHWPIRWCHMTHLFFIIKNSKWSLWSTTLYLVVTMVMTQDLMQHNICLSKRQNKLNHTFELMLLIVAS